ncbi:MAG: hypothetical protein IH934_05655 [Nanoarchaeota archaeon]|nr:hypothetical protein [Nanoarchaeota archaeon]
MIREYLFGVYQTDAVLAEQIFNNIHPFDEDFSWINYRPSDEDFQVWEDNLTKYFSSDKFALRTGEMVKEDGVEKEQMGICPALSLAMYMVRTGHKLTTDYLKQKSLDSS